MRRGAAAEVGAAPAQQVGQARVFFSKNEKHTKWVGWGSHRAYLQRQLQRPPPPLIQAHRLRRGGRVSGGSCRQRAPGRHHVEESRLGKVGVTRTHHPQPHTGARIRSAPTCPNVNMQKVQPGMGQWAPAAELGPSKADASSPPLSRFTPRCISVSQQFAPDFRNSSPNVQNCAGKSRKVDLFGQVCEHALHCQLGRPACIHPPPHLFYHH